MVRALRVLLTLSVFACAFVACEDDESLRSTASIELEISPASFSFPAVEVGETLQSTVQVRNIGTGELRLIDFDATFNVPADYTLVWYRGEDAPAQGESGWLAGIDPIDGNSFPQVVAIAPGEVISMMLQYTASTLEGAAGSVTFQSNKGAGAGETIPITGANTAPVIDVTPVSVDFGRVPAGEVETREVTITNLGTSDLLIDGLALNGSQDFTISLNGGDPILDNTLLLDPDGNQVPGLQPSENVTLQITYAPPQEGPDQSELVIFSNDPLQSQFYVSLTANGASSCLKIVYPEAPNDDLDQIDLPAALIGGTARRTLQLQSCGDEVINIQSVRLEGSPAFALDAATLPMLPAALAAFDPSLPPPSRDFDLTFSPDELTIFEGVLIVESNDALRPVRELPIIGRGTENACPEAAVAEPELRLRPLDIVTLDGSRSTDPNGVGGQPSEYQWTLLSSPMDSSAQIVERFSNPLAPVDGGPADDVTTPEALFFLDLAGEYVFSLTVRDELGATAPSELCPQPDAIVTVYAEPDEDIHIQMIWNTPNDPDQNDGDGTDVDLHFLHPNAPRWNASPDDCYYLNKNPDWGDAGAPQNPSLDLDDVTGAGPENINLDDPEDTSEFAGNYRVGAYYFRNLGAGFGASWGPSDVTMRIFLGGELDIEVTNRLEDEGDFWYVGDIVWTPGDRRVIEVNSLYSSWPSL
ncbi:MAG: choice-of-anchor D domain-containing protein [Myxococcota bacterium]|nr:choice-of-anchor D domain-containing protein [Myxococcota bacterium]